MDIKSRNKILLLTPVFFILCHYLAMIPHEYAHSFMAWLLGYKTNPLALNYGGTSWLNLLLLTHMDENVDYQLIFSSGHHYQAALIAFSGAGIANGSMFILSLWALTTKKIKQHPSPYYFLLLFNLMNLGNIYDYVPIRTFASHGDVAYLVSGLGISPWWIYGAGSYLLAFLIRGFFTETLMSAFINLKITSLIGRASLMIFCVILLFGFFSIPGFLNYGDLSFFLAASSILAIPGIIIILWPTRQWVQQKLLSYV